MNRPPLSLPDLLDASIAPFRRVPLLIWALLGSSMALTLTLGFWSAYRNPFVVALLALVAGLVMALPLRREWTHWRWACLGWIPLTALVLAQVELPLGEAIELWPLPTAAISLGMMVVLGHWRPAWLAAGGVLLVTIGWVKLSGLAVEPAAEMIGWMSPIVAATVMLWVLRRALRRLEMNTAEEAELRLETEELQSRNAAREAYNRELRDAVGDLLDRIATGRPMSPQERRTCTLVEGKLRDRIRGRSLTNDAIEQAIWAARERGAQVTLLDDRRSWIGIDELRGSIQKAAIDLLAGLGEGDSGTIRLLPAGRRRVASLVVGRADGTGDARTFPDPADR
ncbi:hypothetical protein [Granulicoccus phenolivorans]|nr:hypothetical protein [Granulicoccus phenolivorans]